MPSAASLAWRHTIQILYGAGIAKAKKLKKMLCEEIFITKHQMKFLKQHTYSSSAPVSRALHP